MRLRRQCRAKNALIFFEAVILFLLAVGSAAARTYYVAPPPVGNDANDCLTPSKSCATFQRAVDLCPLGSACTIQPAKGTYSQKTDVTYYKLVRIFGPLDKDGNCEDRSAIIVDDRVDGVGQRGSIFFAEDHAILVIQCMTLASYSKGSIGFSTRQFAIGDVNDINFLSFPDGLGVSAAETSKVNIHSPGILGNAGRFISANALSQITVGGTVRLTDGLQFDVAFLSSLFGSLVTVSVDAPIDGGSIKGASYQCNDAIVLKNVVLPGGDAPYIDNEDCVVSGVGAGHRPLEKLQADLENKFKEFENKFEQHNVAAVIHAEMAPIGAELDKNLKSQTAAIGAELDKSLKSQMAAIGTELDKSLKSQTTAVSAELDRSFQMAIQQRRKQTHDDRIRNFTIGVLTLISLANAGFLWWQFKRTRRSEPPGSQSS